MSVPHPQSRMVAVCTGPSFVVDLPREYREPSYPTLLSRNPCSASSPFVLVERHVDPTLGPVARTAVLAEIAQVIDLDELVLRDGLAEHAASPIIPNSVAERRR